MSQKNYLITIVGPTAIGKTALSIQLAKYFKTEIISCDSRQFFKEMTIGTAVPEPKELATVKHHFIQNRSIHNNYNVGQFERDGLAHLELLFQKNNIAVMVGGSGLYVDAILKGLDHFPDVDSTIRTTLNQRLIDEDLTSLQEQLKTLDPVSYKTIAIENPQRVIRALEICIGTGKPYSYYKNKPKKARNFTPITIGLNAEREIIYNRINQRVDIMVTNGLLDEVKALIPYQSLNALNTVGYKELFAYFNGDCTLKIAIEEIKKNTRRFAKRQLTWFKKSTNTIWFDYQTAIEEIIQITEKKLV